MKRRQMLQLGIGLGLGINATARESLVWQERSLVGFGTTLWIKAAHADAARLQQALNESVKAIRSVEKQMSLFDPDSAVSRLNRFGELRQPDTELVSVLTLAQHVSQSSGGAFDVTMQPLWNLWSLHSQSQTLPSSKALSQTRSLVNWQALTVSSDVVRLTVKGMGVSLNGIAQGYAADKVRSVLQAHGVQHALIDTGETSLLGQSPKGDAWRFAVEPSVVSNEAPPVIYPGGWALATSSDAHTVFSADHVHHHILNPHTGDSPTHWASVSVIAPSCALADALTKVFFMCPPQRIERLAKAWGVGVVLQDKRGEWSLSEPKV
ncbi:MAG: FAD:protein FMN transferase [Betaproteobacteria bacterium]|nr:FAD:protein FMN transferase [Betaproteobacteria bacterium]